MHAIEVSGICKNYPSFKLGPFDLTLPTGAIIGFIGENGAGKTTFIKMLLDIVKPDRGTSVILGAHCPLDRKTREDIGVVILGAEPPETLSASELDIVMRRVYQHWQSDVFFAYLKKYGIDLRQRLKTYSTGMKMKLNLAVALSHQAKLLLLDEATSGLDPIARDEIITELQDFVIDADHTVLISSHILSDLERICDYLVFIHRGQLVFNHAVDDLYARFGILQTSTAQFKQLNPKCIIKCQQTAYSVSVLVDRTQYRGAEALEKATIDDIMQLYIKGDDYAGLTH